VALHAAATCERTLRGVAVIDSPIRELSPEDLAARQARAFGPLRAYPTLNEGMRHFRPVPPAPDAAPFVVEHIARQSLRPGPAGWQWKFDPRIFLRPAVSPKTMADIDCEVTALRCEHGIMTRAMIELLRSQLGARARLAELPAASHHVMLDRPLILVAALRVLLT
jgi:hypothetical protein